MNNNANLASRDERSLSRVIGMSEGSEQVLKATMSLSGTGKSAQNQDSLTLLSLEQLCELGTAKKAAKAQKLLFVTEEARSLIYSLTQHCKTNSAETIG